MSFSGSCIALIDFAGLMICRINVRAEARTFQTGLLNLRLICRGAFCFVDYQRIHWSPGGNQSQAELILNRRKKWSGRCVRGGYWHLSAELSFVGSPLEIEIVSSLQSGLVHDRAVEDGTLQQ